VQFAFACEIGSPDSADSKRCRMVFVVLMLCVVA
jgi:hypothetical protein